MFRTRTILSCMVLGLALLGPSTGHAAAAAPAPATTATSATSFTVGTLHVSVSGSQGRPVILIPGLGSGAWVWQQTVEALQADHRVYALTLAGFNGTAAPTKMTDLMGQAQASLLSLIREQKLDHPVLVGHSLGGTLAIAFAENHADLLGGVVAVDGMPIFPGFERVPVEQRKAMATRMAAGVREATPEVFAANQLAYMQNMGVIDPAAAKQYGALQARSNPQVVAQFMLEDLDTDLRPGLDKISVPLLEIMPYNKADMERAAVRGAMPPRTREQVEAYYASLLQGAPDLRVASIAPARHFVMLDQPQAFVQKLRTFLGRVGETQ